jgi:hypothetical protein
MGWRKLKLLMLLVGAVFCLGIAVVSVRWGLADYHADIAYQEIQSWSDGDISETSWQHAQEQMLIANELAPGSGVYLHRLGRLVTTRIVMQPGQKEVLGPKGLDYFERALLVRAQWPATWSELALLKHVLGEHDARFEESIAKATKYGPWEPGVHRQIAIVGSASWLSLSEPTRFDVMGNIERGLSSPSIGASSAVVAALKNSSPGVDIDFFQRLGGILVKIEWLNKNQLQLADLTLTYWDKFTSVQRNSLTAKVVDVVARTGNPTLIEQMEESGIASAICPYLPMDDKFTRLCED